MVSLGIIAFDIGTHSFRKGVATFVAGCVAGPSAISIFLRAGWSLGVETANNVAPNGTFFTSTWLLYKWKDGTEHYFPEDLIFPTQCSVILLWDLWHFGKSGISEAPYRKLQPMEIKTGSIADIRNQKTYFARAKKVMERPSLLAPWR